MNALIRFQIFYMKIFLANYIDLPFNCWFSFLSEEICIINFCSALSLIALLYWSAIKDKAFIEAQSNLLLFTAWTVFAVHIPIYIMCVMCSRASLFNLKPLWNFLLATFPSDPLETRGPRLDYHSGIILWLDTALVNKLVRCVKLSNGAFEVWRLRSAMWLLDICASE